MIPRQWLLCLGLLLGCDRLDSPLPHGTDPVPDAAPADAAPPPRDAESDATTAPVGPVDASPPLPPISVGIEPGPSFEETDGGVARGDAQMMALGVRAMVLHAAWSEYDLEVSGNESRWERLAQRARLYAESGAQVMLALDLVMRTQSLRPAIEGADWYSDQTRTRIERVIDRIYERMGNDIRVLGIGHEIDRYFRVTLNPARGQLRDLVLHALRHARSRAARSDELLVGVSASHTGLLPALPMLPGEEDLTAVLAESDALIATYVPLGDDQQVLMGDQALAALEPLSTLAGARPVLLQEVSYPSSPTVNSSPARQASFFHRLFDLLSRRSLGIQFVSISPHTDPTPAACAEQTATFPNANPALAAARCSLGLWQHGGPAKPAWSAVLSGLLSFYSP